VLIQFLVQDEPRLGGWQSGLYTARGVAKPARRAFALPLAEVTREGSRTILWGQVRPGSGRRPYTIQRWTGSRWLNIGGTKHTAAGGTFETAVTARAGTKVRLHTPQLSYAGTTLLVS